MDLEATINALVTEAAGGGDRGGGSTITQQLVRARLLPQDVIENDRHQGRPVRAQGQGDPAGLQADAGLPAVRSGQEGDHHRLPQPDHLRRRLRRGRGRGRLLRQGPRGPDRQRGCAAGGHPAGARQPLSLRGQQARASTPTSSRRSTARRSSGPASSARGWCSRTAASPGAPRTPSVVNRRNFILKRLHEGKGRWTTLTEEQYQEALNEKIIIKKRQPVQYKAPHFVEAALKELVLILGDRDPYRRRRLQGHDHARLEGAAARREVHLRGRRRAQPAREPVLQRHQEEQAGP